MFCKILQNYLCITFVDTFMYFVKSYKIIQLKTKEDKEIKVKKKYDNVMQHIY